MKIAVVGKGGSGKSTVSWLLVNYLAKQGKKVLAIDADYNMDLTSNLGIDPNNIHTTIYNTEKYFDNLIRKQQDTSYKEFSIAHKNIPFKFTFDDEYMNFVSTVATINTKLILGGIGQENVYYSNKCGHAHLSSLKYYLSMLKTNKDEFVIVDSIAGLDMVNFGLYAGCDMVICVVENHKNSINVLKQVKSTCDRIGTPVYAVINKFNVTNSDLGLEKMLHDDEIIGRILINNNLLNYLYTQTLEEEIGLINIYKNLNKVYKKIDCWENVRKIDKDKLSHRD